MTTDIIIATSASAIPEVVRYAGGSAFHAITVADTGFLRVLRFDRQAQSSMYLDAPFETDFEYPAYFHIALAISPSATRTLAIGLGGGTVVKRMWRDYPDMSVDAVEIDAEVVVIARRFFALPDDPRVRVFVDDGRHFVETVSAVYDIAIVDAFQDDRIPDGLSDEAFLHALRDRMAESGVVVYNFIGSTTGEGSRAFRDLRRMLARTWRHVWVFGVDEGIEAEGGNLVLLASDAATPRHELLARIEDRVGGRVSVPAFHLFGRDLHADTRDAENG